MEKRILYIFTRTPLHVGAGSSVGAIDLPIIRERPTRFPIIPATSLKGTFADEWNCSNNGKLERSEDGKWLFGETDANNACAGAILFGEARLLAFPVRSAKGSFAWITCPLILQRAKRDGALPADLQIPSFRPGPQGQTEDADSKAFFPAKGALAINNQLVLEEYVFQHAGELPVGMGEAFQKILDNDAVWSEVAKRLVVVSDGIMSYFAEHACEIAQHVRIDDETGTASQGGLFNQENVPSETMFYAVLHFVDGRGRYSGSKTASDAVTEFGKKIGKAFQFGADASTGLGWCTVKLV
ncbi:MAG: type III-B CRISPR module RAMP protein Cmr4 [Kiritimatiellae bacterium]|nr:type III-B CRISPR module RAMP protein Cmr4 [Kiritimatiellia bacterium]